MRITVPVAKVLSVLLADPAADRYGLDLMRATGLPSGTLYP
ncbi:MAG TPA: PadR family transcriptional regulator, partial [Pilimelia sp.]|nr:PadR family transcriptional regulator [Pilimelia sp.]